LRSFPETTHDDLATLWNVERDGCTIRCVLVRHRSGQELRLIGTRELIVWSEMFADDRALIERARAGFERLSAHGWVLREGPDPPGGQARSQPGELPQPWDLPEPRPGFLGPPPVPSGPPIPITRPVTARRQRCPWCGGDDIHGTGESAPTDFRQWWRCSTCNRSWQTTRWGKTLLVAGLGALAVVVYLVWLLTPAF
jgi:hypothetical protein